MLIIKKNTFYSNLHWASLNLIIYLCIYFCIYLSVYLFIYLYVLFLNLCTYLFVCLFIYFSPCACDTLSCVSPPSVWAASVEHQHVSQTSLYLLLFCGLLLIYWRFSEECDQFVTLMLWHVQQLTAALNVSKIQLTSLHFTLFIVN